MKTEITYICDCCGNRFQGANNVNGEMSILNFKVIYPGASTIDTELTLGSNGEDHALCKFCTRKLIGALKEMGYEEMYDGCSSCKI